MFLNTRKTSKSPEFFNIDAIVSKNIKNKELTSNICTERDS